jgi:hypothetical protein
VECSIAYGRKQVVKRQKKERVAKVRNFRMQDKGHQMKLTQREFNKMVRLLDSNQGCISCHKQAGDSCKYDAGHYKTTAAMPPLRFDARNVFKQCHKCNTQLSGNLIEYKARLLERFGQAYVDWLEGPHDNPKWTCDQLATMRTEFKAEIRRLERGEPASRDWRKL